MSAGVARQRGSPLPKREVRLGDANEPAGAGPRRSPRQHGVLVPPMKAQGREARAGGTSWALSVSAFSRL